MSANNSTGPAVRFSAAVGNGNPPVFDPLAGFPNSPFFNRKLKFCSTFDALGRVRCSAFTIHDEG